MRQIILGSQSPRRKEILGYYTLPFECANSDFDESSVPFEGDPAAYVNTLSKSKADALHHRFKESIIITADTIVYKDGKVYEKPEDEKAAFQSLTDLVGTWHSVYTGVTVWHQEQHYHAVEKTEVLFNSLSENDIRRYLEKIHWKDKAGGYSIQTAGGLLVKRIDGCYYNVMGLPINAVRDLLKMVDIDLWNYLKD